MITKPKQTREQIEKIVSNWFKYFAGPKEGLVDCPENGVKLAQFIEHHFQGEYSYDNLSYAMESQRNNLIGIGVALTPAMQQEIARREQARKAAELAQQQSAHNQTVILNFIERHAPTGLIIKGDFYPATQDKLVAFIVNKYPGQLLTNAMLKEAIETLWTSLDWFDKAPEATVFRNVVKAPRVLSEQAKIEAGMLPQRDLRSHAETDGKFVNPNEKLREMLKRVAGEGEGPDQIAAEKISVNTRFNRLDHGATQAIRKIFIRDRKGGIDWSQTLKARLDAASDFECQRNRVGKYER